jgi:hypothetical protein
LNQLKTLDNEAEMKKKAVTTKKSTKKLTNTKAKVAKSKRK